MKIKISPDKEKAKSIFEMTKERENFVSNIKEDIYSTILAENYYEIIKELMTAISLTEGYKFIGEYAHKELIEHIKNCEEMTSEDMDIIDDLRIRRNKSSYEGKKIEPSFIKNKEEKLMLIITKLKEIVKSRLGML